MTRPDPNAAQLRLHRRLYPARAVRETIEAFARLAEATVSRQGDYHLVTLVPVDAELGAETLRLEFANYALSRAARSR